MYRVASGRGRVANAVSAAFLFQIGLFLIGLVSQTTPALAMVFEWQPGQAVIGQETIYITKDGDDLLDFARNMGFGYTQLMNPNRDVDPHKPGAGKLLALAGAYIVPKWPHTGIVINIAQQRLYYFPAHSSAIETFPIGVGRLDRVSPTGVTYVMEKTANPYWYVPASVRAEKPELPAVVPPGPDNPLGEYAMRLGWYTYLIHGTNKPYAIGRMASSGCIRMYPEDIESLFKRVPVGTQVRIISENVLAAWVGNELFVQVFPNKSQTDEYSDSRNFTPAMPEEIVSVVKAEAVKRNASVDWETVKKAGMQRTGLLVKVASASARSAWRQ